MSNFEMKYTIRLYDPDLVVEIGNLYKAHSKEFRNKNEFMTCLIRLGVDALNATPPTTPATAAVFNFSHDKNYSVFPNASIVSIITFFCRISSCFHRESS